jgi:hypothetical protein
MSGSREDLIRSCAQSEFWNGHPEKLSLVALHEICSLHAPFESLQNAVAVVFMMSTRRYNRLLSDNPFPLDFLNPARGMPDEPMSPEQLNSVEAVILDPNEICKDKLPLHDIGLSVQIDGLNGDSNSLCGGGIGGHAVRYGQRE